MFDRFLLDLVSVSKNSLWEKSRVFRNRFLGGWENVFSDTVEIGRLLCYNIIVCRINKDWEERKSSRL